jgi:hypothetical protein
LIDEREGFRASKDGSRLFHKTLGNGGDTSVPMSGKWVKVRKKFSTPHVKWGEPMSTTHTLAHREPMAGPANANTAARKDGLCYARAARGGLHR